MKKIATHILDGRRIAKKISAKVSREITHKHLKPSLAVILVGDDPASRLYVSLKKKACKKAGIEFHEYLIDAEAPEADILRVIDFLNADKTVDAMLIQLPLPPKYHTQTIIDRMDWRKDVDGFHPENLKRFENHAGMAPVLTDAIMTMLNNTQCPLENKQALIISKSEVFAKPIIHALGLKKATGKWISPTSNGIENETRLADILIVAVGKKRFITGSMVKPGAMVIDLGTNKYGDKVIGDVNFESVKGIASWITPVPGGIGPLTVSLLLQHTVNLCTKKDA